MKRSYAIVAIDNLQLPQLGIEGGFAHYFEDGCWALVLEMQTGDAPACSVGKYTYDESTNELVAFTMDNVEILSGWADEHVVITTGGEHTYMSVRVI